MRFPELGRRPAGRALLAYLAVLVLLARSLPGQGPALTVHSIFGSRDFANDLKETQWMRDGTAYTYLESDSSDETNLYRVDAVSGARTILVRGGDLVPPGARQPLDVDGYHVIREERYVARGDVNAGGGFKAKTYTVRKRRHCSAVPRSNAATAATR